MLTTAVNAYLAARRVVGFQLRDTEAILRNYASFAGHKGDVYVRTRTVLEWIRVRNSSPLRNCIRLRTVVRFARYLHAEDERHEVPPEDVCGRHRPQRRPPFVFMPQDVERLVRAARALGPESSLRPQIYSTFFGLVASTGMRISEALNLRLEDVSQSGLVIRNTKFGKSRWLPLHATVRQRLDEYLERRFQDSQATCPFVFVAIKDHSRQLHGNTVRYVFRRLVCTLGIAKPEDKPFPRIHDLRFYFANQALMNSPSDHDGIGRHMLALSTYLGHSDTRNSYWYLEATPALFAKVAKACEDFAMGAGS
ncbi:tyrosine-type recombinase/integrase [Endomicrobium sp. AH-315-J14]|nr:tyrosine-type recombinase/integrase [Endomicrobium sp. AH-315-J14]